MNPVSPPPNRDPFMVEGKEGNSSLWIFWLTLLGVTVNNASGAGPTAQRPVTAPYIGFQYWDDTLQRPIWASTITPIVWKDAAGVVIP